MNTFAKCLVASLALAGSSVMGDEKWDITKLDLSKLPPASDQKGLTYEKDIRPLLEASCFRCHGADRQKGDLRLDSLEALLKGGEDGKIVVPGNGAKSLLVASAAQINNEIAMPPKRRGGGPGGPGGFGGFGGPGGGQQNRGPGGQGGPAGEGAPRGQGRPGGPGGPGGFGGPGGQSGPGGPDAQGGPGGDRGAAGPNGRGPGARGFGGPGGPGGGPPSRPLTPEQVGLVRAWIDQGAK